MIKWTEEWVLKRLNRIHKNENKAPSTENFVWMMMIVTIQEDKALANLKNLINLGYIRIHEGKVMLKWYYDVFYNDVMTSWTDGKSHRLDSEPRENAVERVILREDYIYKGLCLKKIREEIEAENE